MLRSVFLATLLSVALTVITGLPADKRKDNSQPDIESELRDYIEVNGQVYVRRPKEEVKKDSRAKETTVKEGNHQKREETIVKDGKKGTKVVEGDIIETPYILELRSGKANGKRNIWKSESYKWPSQNYYYQLDGSLTDKQKNDAKKAMSMIARVSCINFIEKADSGGYVLFRKSPDNGCNSAIGKARSQPQIINVASWCAVATLQHEVLHSLGFLHEQSRPDRDDYVTIKYENILKGLESQFKKYDHPLVTTYNEPYDYNSIMHYPKDAFSKNGEATIVPKKWFTSIGNKEHLSDMDITLLNKHYNCRKCKNTGWGCFVRKIFDNCNRATSSCLGSCGFYCKA